MVTVPVQRVTDHALLRYLQRKWELDLDHVRGLIQELVDEGCVVATQRDGTKKVIGRDGFTYVVTDSGSVTTLFDEMTPVKEERQRAAKPKAGRHSQARTDPHKLFGGGKSRKRNALHRFSKVRLTRPDLD